MKIILFCAYIYQLFNLVDPRTHGCNIKPKYLQIYIGNSRSVTFVLDYGRVEDTSKIEIHILNDDIVKAYPLLNNNSIVVKGLFMGRTNIFVRIYTNLTTYICEPLQVVVVRKMRIVSKIFRKLIILFVIFNTFLYGCKLNYHAIQQFIKKPSCIIVSMFCQLIGMPLLAFFIIVVYRLNLADSMGLFLVGCSPGGGSSNMWTLLLNGDLLLSICLTFVNTLATFASMPFWFMVFGSRVFPDFSQDKHLLPYYGLYHKNLSLMHQPLLEMDRSSMNSGESHYNLSTTTTTTTFKTVSPFTLKESPYPLMSNSTRYHERFAIPYTHICMSLLSVSIPPIIGMAFRWLKPNLAIKAFKWAKPLTVSMLLIIVIVGIWDNTYIFQIMGSSNLGGGLKLLFASMSLPWGGFLLAYLACIFVNLFGRMFGLIWKKNLQQPTTTLTPKKNSVEQLNYDTTVISELEREPLSTMSEPENIKAKSRDMIPSNKLDQMGTAGVNNINSGSNIQESLDQDSARRHTLRKFSNANLSQQGSGDKVVTTTSDLNSIKSFSSSSSTDSNSSGSKISNEIIHDLPDSPNKTNEQVANDTSEYGLVSMKKAADSSPHQPHHRHSHGVNHGQHRHPPKRRNLIPSKHIITIIIETGLQNAGLAVLLLWGIYPQPEADLAITVPVACTIFTPIPLLLVYLVRMGYSFYRKRTAELVVADPL